MPPSIWTGAGLLGLGISTITAQYDPDTNMLEPSTGQFLQTVTEEPVLPPPTGPAQLAAGTSSPANQKVNGTVTALGFAGSGTGLTSVNAATVANGVYTTGSYADPTWITSLSGAKIVGPVAVATTALSLAGGAGGLQDADAPYRTAFGFNALANDVTNVPYSGYYNTGVGHRSLWQNTTGGDNTAVGFRAGIANTTGSTNTAVGSVAMESNTTGGSNTAVGAWVLRMNTTGAHNTALGQSALYNNTTGGYNTAVGTNAMYANSSGGHNTARRRVGAAREPDRQATMWRSGPRRCEAREVET